MKTKLFLIATLFISTITFSQNSRKGYNSDDYYYKYSSNTKMNKAELIDAMSKDGNISKRAARVGRNPQTGATIKAIARHNWVYNVSRTRSSKQELEQIKAFPLRKKPGRTKGDPIPGMEITAEQGYQGGDDLHIRKKPGRSKTIGNSSSTKSDKKRRIPADKNIINPPLPTKATDYNSSRSNKNTNH